VQRLSNGGISVINLWRSLRFTIVFAVLLGLIYPLLITGIGNVLFPFQAQGSLLQLNGQVVGSELIAQATPAKGLFQPRPSAVNYTANLSGGSNFGPTNPALITEVKNAEVTVKKNNPSVTSREIPADMVESSASGLDPDLSIADARLQVARIAQASGISQAFLFSLIHRLATSRTLGIWGEPMVNVMQLNEAILLEKGQRVVNLR